MPKRVLTFLVAAVLLLTEVVPVWDFLDLEVPTASAALCTISADTDITSSYASGCDGITVDTSSTLTFHGENLDMNGTSSFTVNEGVTVTWSGTGIFTDSNDSITISGTLTHLDSGSGVVLSASGNVNIAATGSIDVDYKGCNGSAGSSANGFGPNLSTGVCAISTAGAGDGQSFAGGGGGHGYDGGKSYDGVAGATYGSQTAPILLGSGGGGAQSAGYGGDGGGRVWLDVSGTLTIDGDIFADGEVGTIYAGAAGGGGGSGGSIYINAGTLDGGGVVSSDGGDGANGGWDYGKGGGGAGGRIAIYYGTLGTFNLSNVAAIKGDIPATPSQGGATEGYPGTTFILDRTTDDGAGTLTVTSGLQFFDGDDYVRTGITISDNANLYCDAQTTLNIGSTGNINFTGGNWLCSEAITTTNLSSSGTITVSGVNWDITNTANFNLAAANLTTSAAATIDMTKSDSQFDIDIDNGFTLNNWTYTGVDGGTNASGGLLTMDDAVAVVLVNTDINSNASFTNLSSLEIDPNSSLNANSMGCDGTVLNSGNGYGPNEGTGICAITTTGYGDGDGTGAGGAGHGGPGGESVGGVASTTYGSQAAPVLIGSGGGGSQCDSDGGDGGGKVRVDVTGTMTLNGSISANGTNGVAACSRGGGGGSGGSIYVTTGTLSGTGTIDSDGGNGGGGATGDGSGGGGGRIAVYYDTLSGFTLDNITADGGSEGGVHVSHGDDGKNGTTYILDRKTDDGVGNLRVTSGLEFQDGGDYVRDGIVIDDSSYLHCEAQTTLNIGATSDIAFGSGSVWSCTNTITTTNLSATGTISASNMDWDITKTTNLNVSAATFTASGTNALDFTTSNMSFDLDVDNDVTLSGWTLTMADAGTATDGSLFTIDDAVTVDVQNSTLYSNVNWSNLTGLSIDSASSIDADSMGCDGTIANSGNGYGPNASTGVCTITTTGYGDGDGTAGGGAGHGGAGGNSHSGIAGSTYDSESVPALLGSGGGGSQCDSDGGDGGGIVTIDVNGTFTLAGTITADGTNGVTACSRGGGGGSGGSVNIGTVTLAGTGSISADGGNGGDGSTGDGGGGGGGRVALTYVTDSGSINITTDLGAKGTSGGGNATAGASGTIYSLIYTAPGTPWVTAGSGTGTYNNGQNPTLAGSTFASNGKAHTSSDWKVTTDSAGSNVVWSKSDDASNLESIVVNSSNGTFAGALSGETELASYTTYYAFTRYTNVVGDSSWSNDGHEFTTTYTGSSSTQTWHFNESTPATYYTYTNTIVDVDVVDSMASLTDLGGGTYTVVGAPDSTTKKKAVAITNSGGELTNYQVRMTVTYDSDMQADFDDLRFTDTDGSTEIDYYVESYTASTSAVVWVEVPTVAASGDTVIYMYYGNGSASSESNGSNVFIFFDDFETYTGWETVTSGNVSQSSSQAYEGTYSIKKDTAGDPSGGRKSLGTTIDTSSTDVVVETFIYRDILSGSDADRLGIEDASGNGYSLNMSHSADTIVPEKRVGGTGSAVGSTASVTDKVQAWYIGQLIITSTQVQARMLNTDYSLNAESALNTESTYSSFTYAYIRGGHTYYVDLFRVRKYASSEPSVAFGSEIGVTGDYDNVKIIPASGGSHPEFGQALSFDTTLSGNNAGSVKYQLSNDGTNWYYHNGSSWTSVSDDSTDSNTETQVNNYIPTFATDAGTGSLYFKAFLISNGTQKVEIDSIAIDYDAGAPANLSGFAFDSSTATTATFTWTAASDDAFSHYEVWYGESQSDVQNRTGTATEWDNDNDANLATAGTTTTTITGLSAGVDYYAKIWALDSFGSETTLSDISFNTNQSPTASGVTASQATDGTSYVTISFTADDPDDDDTVQTKVEYNVGAGWNNATLLSSVTSTYGTPVVNNSADYRIGTAAGYITTSSGANTITATWDSDTDLGTTDTSSAQIRITPYDGIAEGSAASSSTFTLDQLAPSGGFSEVYTTNRGETEVTIGWDPVTTEDNFSQYTIYYKLENNGTYSQLGTLSSMNTATTTLTGLAAGNRYNVYLQAADSYGNAVNSPVLTFNTRDEGEGGAEADQVSQAGGSGGGSGVGDGSDGQAGEEEAEEEDYDEEIETPVEEEEDTDQQAGEEEAGEEDYDGEITQPSEDEEEEEVEIPVEETPVEEEVAEEPVVEEEPEDYISEPLHESPEEEVPEEGKEPITVGVFDDGKVAQEVYEDEIVISYKSTDSDVPTKEITITIDDGATKEIKDFYIAPPTSAEDLEDFKREKEERKKEIINSIEDFVNIIEEKPEATKEEIKEIKEAIEIMEEALEDSDNDGILDVWEETVFEDTEFDGTADTDGDGLTDLEEFQAGSDPFDADTDNDGLSDLVEEALGTDPTSADSDKDGKTDTEEIFNEEDPTTAEYEYVDPVMYDEDNDTDGDGLSDYMEEIYNTDPYSADSDGDGITDIEEIEYDTNPTEVDYIEELDTKITNVADETSFAGGSATFKGTSTPSTTATVYIMTTSGSTQSVVTTTTDEKGKFSITTEDLPDGEYELLIVSTDDNEIKDLSKVTSFTVDSTQEVEEIEILELGEESITESQLGSGTRFSITRPKLSGYTKPGYIIYVTWKSVVLTSVIVADTSTGEFEAIPPDDLAEEEDHTVYVYAVDPETNTVSETVQVNFTIGETSFLHESAAQREADEKTFPYMTLILLALVAAGGSFVLLRRGKSQQQEERKLIKKL